MSEPIAIEEETLEMAAPIISVRDLKVQFTRPDGQNYCVVDGVNFDVGPNEILGIVGESGSGKSLTSRSILRLLPSGARASGSVRFGKREIFDMPEPELRALRGGEIAIVFQDAMTSFNPVLRVGDQIKEALVLHEGPTRRKGLSERVVSLLRRVGFADPQRRAKAYPHELSGGMRQRALTAMALANDPILLIADEPTTALDVTVQDQIMDLMRDLNSRSNTAVLLITHNIAVVASLCSRVIVMYAGQVVEDGLVDEVLTRPSHPYTWSLLKSVPRLERKSGRLVAIAGQPPDPAALPPGCRFAPRCPFAKTRCSEGEPRLAVVASRHLVRCWFPLNPAGEPA